MGLFHRHFQFGQFSPSRPALLVVRFGVAGATADRLLFTRPIVAPLLCWLSCSCFRSCRLGVIPCHIAHTPPLRRSSA